MKLKKNIDKIYVALLFICSIIFVLPSILYLIKNKTIYRFFWVWTYLFKRPETQSEKFLNAGLFFIILTGIFLFYIFVIKKHKSIFKNKKQIFILIAVISMLFVLIIPYTSTDVYSYIANGWSASHYKENPYYTATGQIADKYQISAPMFNKVANCWRYETVVYGPLWTLICTGLSRLSFGNIDLALLVFKIANLLVHMINCVLIYKITKKEKFLLLYGLNPFILFEALANVHNDIFIILFILLAIYFVKNKKNLFIAVACVAMATAIKYLAILLLPFIVLYSVRDKQLKERIKCCIYCAIEYIAIIAMLYFIYLKDFHVLAGLFIQQGKYNRSVFYILYYILNGNISILSTIQNIALVLFAVYYLYVVIKLLLNKDIKFYKAIQSYHVILLLFTFILITNFNPWYIMWLFPTMFYLKGSQARTILNVAYAGQIANILSFALWSEEQFLSLPYFTIMLVATLILNQISKAKKVYASKRKCINEK